VVLKSSASAIDTDSVAKIASVACQYVTLRILLLCSPRGNDKMISNSAMGGETFAMQLLFLAGANHQF
jgi:hypothetical protein